MKRKWILRVVLGIVVVLIAVFVTLALSLGAVVKRGVETIGPKAAQVEVKLRNAEVWVFACRVDLSGILVGNPKGYKTPCAMTVNNVTVSVKPGSVFSDKVVLETIHLKDPVITLEGGLKNNNLTTIEKNLDDYVGSSSTAPNSTAAPSSPAKSERKLQVNDLVISGAKLQVNMKISGSRTVTLAIPEIHLTELGTGPEGITAVEVGQRTLHAVLMAATSEITKNAANLGIEGADKAKNAVQKAADAVKGWFHH